MAEKKAAAIVVKSKGERFRRAGIEFTRDGVEIDPAELTAEQAEAINNEPNLVVVGGDLVGTKKAAAKKAGA
jgi:hypothetical protein